MHKTVVRAAVAFAIVLVATSPAPAFYWSLQAVPSLVNPIPPLPGADPLPLPPDTPVPGGGPGGPGNVPEPATAVVGAIGLMMLGARRALRKR